MKTTDKYTKNIIIFSNTYQHERDYWLEQLKNHKGVSVLPYDTSGTLNQLGTFTYVAQFPKIISDKIIKLCRESLNGIFVVVMTGICYLLQQYTDEKDILIGCPILLSNADNHTNEFIPFSYVGKKANTFKECVMEFQNIIVKAYQYQTYPLSDVFETLKFALQDAEPFYSITVEMQGVHRSSRLYGNRDLAFIIGAEDANIELKVKYNAQLYSGESIENIVHDLIQYFEYICADYNKELTSLSILSEESLRQWKEKRTVMNEIQDKLNKQDDGTIEESNAEYILPQTEKEKELMELWKEILGEDKIGIHDNFFRRGGDSLKAVKLVAYLYKYGVKVKDVYDNPTIKQLAELLLEEKTVISQENITGEVPLSPIQQRFFGNREYNISYYNQTMVLYRENYFDLKCVDDVVQAIIRHHDMLRAQYIFDKNEVVQIIQTADSIEQLYISDYIDVTKEKDERTAMESIAQREQASLNLSQGPLIKAICFHTKNGDHLLFIMHHLLVDAYSWRIILECFAIGYKQRILGEEIVLPDKTDSYKKWVNKLIAISRDSVINGEREYWSRTISHLRTKTKQETTKYIAPEKNRQYINLVYSVNDTRKVLARMIELNISIEDFILTNAILSLRKSYVDKLYVVDLENHGRGDIDDEVNVSRTVGWFTNIYPIGVEFKGENVISCTRQLHSIIQSVPSQGFGYQLLKFYANQSGQQAFDLQHDSEILFNYLGEFDNDIDTEVFQISDFYPGSNVDPEMPNPYLLDINGAIINRQLRIGISYMNDAFTLEQITNFKKFYNESVCDVLAEECYNKETVHYNKFFIEGLEPFNELLYKDCFYNAFFPIVKYYNKSIDVFLSNDIIIYTNDGSKGHIDVDYKESKNIIDLANMYGIKTRQLIYSQDIIKTIKEAIVQQHPVIVRVDCFYLRGRPDTYLSKHWPHTLLVLGFDDKQETIAVFEQSDINSLDFTLKHITYFELVDAYEGLNSTFIVDEKSPSFIEFELEESISIIKQTDAKKLFIESYLQNRNQREAGLLVLEKFIDEFEIIINEPEIFANSASRLALSFKNILKSKYVEKFSLSRLFLECINMKQVQELIQLWRQCLNILDKYIYSQRYKLESVKKIHSTLITILSLEKDLHQQILGVICEYTEEGDCEV